ncbi:MAG: hypothetical protein ACREDA_11120, partial [Methylocella sp.]
MTTSRPPYELALDLPIADRGGAPHRSAREAATVTAVAEPESPASTEHPMAAITSGFVSRA